MTQARESETWLRRGDLWIAAAVLSAALLFLLLRAAFTPPGQAAELTTPDGVQTLSLSEDTVLTLTGRGGLRVTVEVSGGAVRFSESGCPDQVCVRSGWLKKAGDTAACVPAGILLRVTGDGDGGAEVDVIAG